MLGIGICMSNITMANSVEKFIREKKCFLKIEYLGKPRKQINYLSYDIVILELSDEIDIQSLIEQRAKNPNCIIIIIDKDYKFVEQSFKLKVFKYLIFPSSTAQIVQSIIDAIVEKQDRESYYICENGRKIILNLTGIYYFEYISKQTHAHGVKTKISFYKSLKSLSHDLETKGFIRCHNSYVVNVSKIKSFNNNSIEVINGEVVPISRTYKENTLNTLNMYFNRGLTIQKCLDLKCLMCKE